MLEELRKRIDKIDDEMARLFTERLAVTEEIALVKKEKNLPVQNSRRESDIIDRLAKGHEDELSEYITILFTAIFEISRAQQSKIIGSES